MKEQLVSFETAKLAKEKGFSEFTQEVFNQFGKLFIFNSGLLTNHERIQAPTQSLLQKWLIEEHKIRVFPNQGAAGNFIFNIYTYPIPNNIGKWDRFNNIQSYNTYEEALEKGLQEALTLIT